MSESDSSLQECALPEAKLSTDFLQAWDMSDVSFVVEGKYVYGSRTILAMWSPVLKAMFYDDFKEKFAVKIDLPEKHFDDILELMKVLHPPNKELDESNVGILLPLAREYQMDHLLFRCERFLLTRPPSVQGLVLAEEFSLDCLKQQCMRYIKTNKLKDLKAEAEFDILKNQTKVQILLEKSMKYETLVYEVKEIVTGHRPEQVRFRTGGTLCTFTCSDKDKSSGRLPHSAGTDMCCKRCAVYMISRIGKEIENLS